MSKVNIAGYKIEKDPTAPNLITDPQGGSSDLPSGGTTGQVLTKLSDDDGDAGWEDPTGDTDITMSVTVDGSTGTPAATVTKTMVQDVINFLVAFTGLKGETGARGLQGPRGATGSPGANGQDGSDGITPVVTAQATVDSTSGNPSVTVAKTGTDVAPIFTFNFSGLKGEQGIPGTGEDGVGITSIAFDHVDAQGNNVYVVTLSNSQTYTFTANTGATPDVSVNATVDAQTGTPGVTVTKTGSVQQPVFNLAFTGLKGEQGPAGQSAEIDAVFGGNTGDLTQVEYDSTNNELGLTMDDNGTTRSVAIPLGSTYDGEGRFVSSGASMTITAGSSTTSLPLLSFSGISFPSTKIDLSLTLPVDVPAGVIKPIFFDVSSAPLIYYYVSTGMAGNYTLVGVNNSVIQARTKLYVDGSLRGYLYTFWSPSMDFDYGQGYIFFKLMPEAYIKLSAATSKDTVIQARNQASDTDTSYSNYDGNSYKPVIYDGDNNYSIVTQQQNVTALIRVNEGTVPFVIEK